jgi:oxygen-independent coproporphyrinogen III oxidase
MEQIARLRALGLFDARVPRYTSYPTAPVFSPAVGSAFQAEALAGLDPSQPVSLYLHIPFCERLCWFCACHTQGTKTLHPVEAYLEILEAEIAQVAALLPSGIRMARLHWGGGTPTILPPPLIHRLARAIKSAIPQTEDWEFSVEIDPTMVDRAKIAALRDEGLNRASIGIQDFAPEVQAAIGRIQPFDVTAACVADLREAGIRSLNADLVYGLPHQSEERIRRTVEQVLDLGPDRLALYGYAHVPWVSKRQKLIPEDALPREEARHNLARVAGEMFRAAGYDPIGIDHFAKPGDGLAVAAREGRLRRNFQGYTDDTCPTLIGLGASSISRFPGGYVQNAHATAAYEGRIRSGALAGAKGHALTAEDRLRARAIEMLMCDFRLDMTELRGTFGEAALGLARDLAAMLQRYDGFVASDGAAGLRILPQGRPLTRMIASQFDAYVPEGVRYSHAS